jgi:hypothetical protein
MAVALPHVLPDGVVFFAYDLGGWGGYYVGFFTSADSLEYELAEFKVKHGVDTGEEGAEWYLQSPEVCVVRDGVVSTLERFTRDNFPDVDTESWSLPQREIAGLQKKLALRSEHLLRTFAVNEVRPLRKRKREREEDIDVPAVFLLLDNGLVGLATSTCESQIPKGSTCYCLTVMNTFVSCESGKYISVKS